MTKKFDIILLPPDSFHLSFNDLFSSSRKNFTDLENKIKKMSESAKKKFMVKYRTNLQRDNYPCTSTQFTSYGNLFNYCHSDTIVIGPVSTALLETISNNIKYFSYDFAQAYKQNRMLHNNASDIFCVALTPDEVINNITYKKIFKDGKSQNNIFNKKALTINELVNKILNEN